jgi:adenine-specific DNA-methyltransferase
MTDRPTIKNCDALELLADIEDNTVQLVAVDPPYFRFLNEPWDRQWDDRSKFLQWIGQLAREWQRVLAPNGSLYCFASPQMAAQVQMVLAESFEILNEIVWVKPSPFLEINKGKGNSGKVSKPTLRKFYNNTERIIFAEQLGHESEWQSIRSSVVELTPEMSSLRRRFAVTAEVPFTDVWVFPTEPETRNSVRHPCEKPAEMMRHIISSSTREGDLVLDCFAGSGTTAIAALSTGRQFIGCDASPKWAEYANNRITTWEPGRDIYRPQIRNDAQLDMFQTTEETTTHE